MTKPDITPQQRITILKHLANGKGPDVVATISGFDRSTVLDIGSHHGYPDREKLKWAVDILEKKTNEDRTNEITPRPDLAARRPTPTAAPEAAPLTKPDEIRVLINTAKGHPSKRIQRAADKVLDDIDRLRGLIAEDQEKNAERRKAAAEKAAARAEVERLEAQLAAAKAKLRGNTAAPKANDDGPTAAQIRGWAADAGVECPNTGRVPGHVREAYDQAHQTTDSESAA